MFTAGYTLMVILPNFYPVTLKVLILTYSGVLYMSLATLQFSEPLLRVELGGSQTGPSRCRGANRPADTDNLEPKIYKRGGISSTWQLVGQR